MTLWRVGDRGNHKLMCHRVSHTLKPFFCWSFFLDRFIITTLWGDFGILERWLLIWWNHCNGGSCYWFCMSRNHCNLFSWFWNFDNSMVFALFCIWNFYNLLIYLYLFLLISMFFFVGVDVSVCCITSFWVCEFCLYNFGFPIVCFRGYMVEGKFWLVCLSLLMMSKFQGFLSLLLGCAICIWKFGNFIRLKKLIL